MKLAVLAMLALSTLIVAQDSSVKKEPETQSCDTPSSISEKQARRLCGSCGGPHYPLLAREARVEGPVELKAIIDKEGRVKKLDVISGNPLLVPAAIEAVENWKFKPYKKNGHSVEIATNITVNFSLAK